MVVGQYLDLDVTWTQNCLLQEHAWVSECALGLARCLDQRGSKVILVGYSTHAATTTAGNGLHKQREADDFALVHEFVDVGTRRRRLQNWNASSNCRLFRSDLVSGHLENIVGRTDKGDSGLGSSRSQLRVFTQKAIARINCVCARLFRDANDFSDIEVRTNRVPLGANLVCLIRLKPVSRIAVLVWKDGDSFCAKFVGSAHSAYCDFTTVCNQDFLEHSVLMRRVRTET